MLAHTEDAASSEAVSHGSIQEVRSKASHSFFMSIA
jgi:hypothetical protein